MQSEQKYKITATINSVKQLNVTLETEKKLNVTLETENKLYVTLETEKQLNVTPETEKQLNMTLETEKQLNITLETEKQFSVTLETENTPNKITIKKNKWQNKVHTLAHFIHITAKEILISLFIKDCNCKSTCYNISTDSNMHNLFTSYDKV